MRNLRNIQHDVLKFSDEPLTVATFDLDGIVCAFGPSETSPTITLRRHGPGSGTHALETITSWDAPSPHPDLAYDRIIDLHCFVDVRIITLVLEGGDIIVVREEPGPGEDPIEIVGSVDAGILAARWSPDEELLAIVTKAETLLFMTREFDGRANIVLSTEDLKVSNHVSVGWGKRETQFKGRGVAKTLRDPTMPEHVDEGIASSLDDGAVSITWRGDGELLAVNSMLDMEPRRRVIRVFSRDGNLESVSEPINGIEGALSWKPSGQLLAAIQRKEESIDVVFFERNGLRHGEFDLRLGAEECRTIGKDIRLSWNIDSTVLAIILADRIQLWTTGNYHYYLKQEIFNPCSTSPKSPVKISWHPEKPLRLICYTGERLHMLDHSLVVSRGPVIPPYDYGVVASIDGKSLKVTPLRTANIPPPMCLDNIQLPETIIDVAINSTATELAILHTNNEVTLYSFDYSIKNRQLASLTKRVSLNKAKSTGICKQITAVRDGTYAVLSRQDCTDQCYIVGTNGDVSTYELNFVPLSFIASPAANLYIEDSEGRIYAINSQGSTEAIATLPTSCAHAEAWENRAGSLSIFGLSNQGTLHIFHAVAQQKLRISGCTSFVVTESHLIYTTSQHLLKFVHLHDGELEIAADEPETDERCRNVERGAKIVTAVPSSLSLILQMPRGNIETIYPRALVLSGIRANIKQRNYRKAFSICRTQRVDMNILYDYAPAQFAEDIAVFINQVKKVEYVDLFLSSLSEDNMAETIYKETLSGKDLQIQAVKGVGRSGKINRICDGFLAVMEKDSSRLQNVVTAHVCKNPPDLSAGLSLISSLQHAGQDGAVEQAVDHICFLADVNRLYETALGLYNLDVALLVAQQSQKDPREYLPYLQRIKGMSPLRQRYQLDHDLQNHAKALSHLHELDEFDELKSYMTQHELYSAAIELYRYDAKRLAELMRLYAQHCSARNQHKEAGIAYEYVGDYNSAYEAYRAATMWQECLAAAELVPVSNKDLMLLAQDLAASLEEAKEYSAAATIHLDYLDDLHSAARLTCKAYRFGEAIRLIAHKKPALLSSVVDAGLVEASAAMTELLAEMKTQLQNQVPRLRELREKKAEDPMGFLDGGVDGENGVDIPDNISLAPTEASTTGTFMTRYTNRSTGTLATNATRRTSRNRRREERKRAKGKKGTVYEEEYLVNSIARLIERLNATMDDVSQLIQGLVRRTMRERAVAVESAMLEVYQACKDSMGEVFVAPVAASFPAQDVGGQAEGEPARPYGGQGVLWDVLHANGQNMPSPVLKKFERLSLLG